jgi:ABC-type sugar transport system ATPase subunit
MDASGDDVSLTRRAPGGGAPPGLRLRAVGVRHPDGTVALDGVTLDVAPGEVVAVVGPSGSGKTTLLRAVAGLVKVAGTVEIGGRDVTHLDPQRRDLAMVFETGALISSMDVEDNIGFGLRVQKVPPDERHERVAAEAGRLRLAQLLSRRPENLSAGERGRAHIGHALIRRPVAWLLDEPLSHLDPVERSGLRRRLVREAKRQQVPTLYVTHDPAEALAVGDRVALLREGRLVQVATPRDLYARPANAFVAAFVASEPVGQLLARVVGSGRFAGLRVGDRTLPFWSGLPAELEEHVGREVALVLRAQDVRDAADVEDPDLAHLRGVVVGTEFTGPSVLATVRIEAPAPSCPGLDPGPGAVPGTVPGTGPGTGPGPGSGPDPAAWPAGTTRLVARLPRDHPARPGAQLTLAVDATRAHIFHPDTGQALWHPPAPSA